MDGPNKTFNNNPHPLNSQELLRQVLNARRVQPSLSLPTHMLPISNPTLAQNQWKETILEAKTSKSRMLTRPKVVALLYLVNESNNRIATVLFLGIWEVLTKLNGLNWIITTLFYAYKNLLVKLSRIKVISLLIRSIPIFLLDVIYNPKVVSLWWFLLSFQYWGI